MSAENKKPVSIELFRVNRGREKLCQCNRPHYEVDTVNRIVMCTDCGAVVEPFEALLTVCRDYERYNDDIKRLRKKASIYAQEADKEFKRMCRNRVFREMESQYRKNLLPSCPECGKYFDPAKINRWTNKKFLEVES